MPLEKLLPPRLKHADFCFGIAWKKRLVFIGPFYKWLSPKDLQTIHGDDFVLFNGTTPYQPCLCGHRGSRSFRIKNPPVHIMATQ
jgi:hypothetical protein